MCKMYGRIENLCAARNIKVGKMCSDLGISRGVIGDLKAGRTKQLSVNNLEKIASYFSVTVEYLTGKEKDIPDIYLTDFQQQALLDIFASACKQRNLTFAEAFSQSPASNYFFPRLEKCMLHQASRLDLIAVADFLCVKDDVMSIIDRKAPISDYAYALHEETKDLPVETQELIMKIVKEFRAQQRKNGETK